VPNPPSQQDVYWPSKSEPKTIKMGKNSELEITQQSSKTEANWTERIFTVTNRATNTSRVVIHLQATEAKVTQAELFADMARACLSYYRQQRVLTHPVLVHCTDGSGKSAAFALMTAAMSEVDLPVQDDESLVPDLVKMGALMCRQRKGILRERMHLKQAYEGVLNHAKHVLTNKQVLTPDLSKTPSGGQVDFSVAPSVAGLEQQPPLASNAMFQSSEMLASLNLSDPLGLNSPASNSRNSPNKKKITKQDFLNAADSKSEDLQKKNEASDDPLSQLDPLWSLKPSNKP